MSQVERIFQILISDPDQPQPSFTAQLDTHIASFRAAYPRAEYQLYETDAVRTFIQDRFGDRILRAYDRIVPYAYKADLARYCLLYELGGVYSDLSHRHTRPIDMADAPLVVFRDLPRHPPWAVSNGLIAARPGRWEFKRAIHLIARYSETGFHGGNPLDPTGPYLFGRVLAQSTDWPLIQFGTSAWRRSLWPLFPDKVRVRKRMPDGLVVAEKVKSGHASIADFVDAKGNDYNQLWEDRAIWADPDQG